MTQPYPRNSASNRICHDAGDHDRFNADLGLGVTALNGE